MCSTRFTDIPLDTIDSSKSSSVPFWTRKTSKREPNQWFCYQAGCHPQPKKRPKIESCVKRFLYSRGMIGLLRVLRKKKVYRQNWVTSRDSTVSEFWLITNRNCNDYLHEPRPKIVNWLNLFLYSRGMVGWIMFLRKKKVYRQNWVMSRDSTVSELSDTDPLLFHEKTITMKELLVKRYFLQDRASQVKAGYILGIFFHFDQLHTLLNAARHSNTLESELAIDSTNNVVQRSRSSQASQTTNIIFLLPNKALII